MMRKWAVWLVGMALLFGSADASMADTSGPENVLVVYCSANAQSLQLAQLYQAARSIPGANMLGVTGPTAWASEDNISATKADVYQYLYVPVTQAVATLKAAGTRIDYVVLCRNLPFNILQTSGSASYSVDGALMSPNGGYAASSSSAYYNDFYKFPNGSFADYKAGGASNPNSQASQNAIDEPVPFLVTRLDGQSWAIARLLITRAQAVRNLSALVFLNGNSAAETPNSNGADIPDDVEANIATAAADLTAAGVANEVVTDSFSNPGGPICGYFSYGTADSTYQSQLFGSLKLSNGSIGALGTGFTATDLRSTVSNLSGQMTVLLSHGLTGGIGNVALYDATANVINYKWDSTAPAQPDIYLDDYFIHGMNLADSLYASLPYIGYVYLVLGDPLCTYAIPAEPSTGGISPSTSVGSTATWGVGSSSSDTGTGHVGTGAPVGSTSTWGVGGGGGGNSTTHVSW